MFGKTGSILWSLVLLVLLSFGAACAPAAAPTPTPVPPKPAPKAEATKPPAPAATQPAKPAAATPAAAAKKPEVAQLRAGVMPIENNSIVYAADKLGYFKDEGLTVETSVIGGGAEIIPGVIAGRLNFGYSNVVSVLQARAQGFDVVIVSGVVAAPSSPPDADRMMVKADSTLKTANDLVGKRLGTNNLNNIVWLLERAWLKKGGADPDKVTFREIPFPQMADAIVNGQIDVGWTIEPFGSVAVEAGKLKVFAHPLYEYQPGMDVAVFVASEKWVKENPNTAAGYANALGRAIDLMTKNVADRKKYGIEFTKTEPALMDKIVLAPLRTKVDQTTLQKTADLMVEHGLLKEKLDVSKMIWASAK
ncbi:MAG: ABC transporter substrate-binding protein [Chloroflexi bacterium]|nr:ABC transporter substrate-binding protein [Chloroflexota bacterium]